MRVYLVLIGVLCVVPLLISGKSGRITEDVQEVCHAKGHCPKAGDVELGEELRRIERDFLIRPQSDDEKRKPELVNDIVKNFIQPNLHHFRSDVLFMGSFYEWTSVPGRSDFDIQFFIKLPNSKNKKNKTFSTEVEKSVNPAWRRVKGGTLNLQENGYLSAAKARKLIQSEVDKSLQAVGWKLKFSNDVVNIKRSTSGPATTLNVEWRKEKLGIDIVVCLKSEDLGIKDDLVGKPYSREQPKLRPDYWRLSYSRQELKKLREYYQLDVRKIILLRIMKVLKNKHAQFNYFPSYFYKNLLFKLVEDNPHALWGIENFSDRFKDMIATMLEALRTQTLYLHFNKEVNYLANKDKHQLQGTVEFLRKVIDKNRYVDLLKAIK